MKKTINLAIAVSVMMTLLASCKKEKPTPAGKLGSNFPTVLNNILTPAVLDSLMKHGTVINSGTTPPTVSGTYLFHPDYCTYDNSGDESAGSLYDDYKYKFSNQNTANFTVSVDYEDTASQDDGSDGAATYISGSGSLFTIFAQTTGTSDGISYTSLQVISGEVATGTVKNMQISSYLQSKNGDAGNSVLERVGSTRIFNDQDGSSEATTFSVSQAIQSLNTNNNAARHFLSAFHSNKNK